MRYHGRSGPHWKALTLFLALAALAPGAQAATADDPNPEVITVTAHLPGPAPWRVSKGEHVLWIFAYPEVVPETLEWDSARLERALGRSQEFLARPRLDLGFRIAPARLELPEEKILADVLPTTVYADYLALKAELFPDGDTDALERLQPEIAGPSLLRALYGRSGLGEGTPILRRIDTLARAQRNLRKTRIEVKPSRAERVQLRELYAASLAEVPAEQGIACFAAAIANVKGDIAVLQERAKAWAEGYVTDVSGMLTSREKDDYCGFDMADTAEREVMERLGTELYERWFAAADAALTRNESTVAIWDIDSLLKDETGVLQQLRQRGYTVEHPAL